MQRTSIDKGTHILYFKNQMSSNNFEHINAGMQEIAALRGCIVSVLQTGIYLQRLVSITLVLMNNCIP